MTAFSSVQKQTDVMTLDLALADYHWETRAGALLIPVFSKSL